MKHLKILLLLLATLGSSPLYAQLHGQGKIDSLLKELPSQKEDTGKVALLASLCHSYASLKPEEGIRYGIQGLDIAKRLQWKKGIADLCLALAINYRSRGDFTKSLEYYQQSAKLGEEAGNIGGFARATGGIGSTFRSLGDSVKALEYFVKAVDLFEKLGDKAGIATFTGNIGNLYCDELKNYPKALEYMMASLKLFDEIGDKKGVARNAYNIGNVYGYQKNYTAAIAYYESSLKIARETDDMERISDNLSNIAAMYLYIIEDTSFAGKRKNVAMTGLSEFPVSRYRVDNTIPNGRAALLRGAFDYLEKAIKISEEIEDLYANMENHKCLAKAYVLNGDYKRSLEASDKFHALQDSIFSQDNREQILKLDMKYEYDRQRYADSMKNAEKEKIAAINLQKQKSYTYMGIAGILLLAGFSFFIVKERGKSETARKQSDELLLNILPGEVASELKTTGTTAARHYDNVTILFTDFVNFTQAGEQMSPQALIDELHTCFKAFDEITGIYDIEKIKTIGDAYLAICGLPRPDPQHAVKVVKAATEINAFMADRFAKLGNRTFEVRIGIHSGSVVAGIVGVKKFAYDIWGDTVNTAARMEQHGEAGRINISETTYNLVKDKFTCEYRGEVEAKGKGVMKMYFVG